MKKPMLIVQNETLKSLNSGGLSLFFAEGEPLFLDFYLRVGCTPNRRSVFFEATSLLQRKGPVQQQLF